MQMGGKKAIEITSDKWVCKCDEEGRGGGKGVPTSKRYMEIQDKG